ncbi:MULTISPECIES: hypothetical protein [Sphingomonas]|uniref:hypothetical protein n=1 Tax=Sphingomonas TaxID=13687 RepID=UPI000DEFC9F4|nr:MULTISPECIES: hypothetical protein [Sphingomonas]
MQTPAEALAADAASYATAHGVTPDEAERRLRLQLASVGAAEHLRTQFADRLGGLFVEHRPEWRLVVLLTGDVPSTRLLLPSGGMQVPVELRGGAGATRAAVLAALDAHRRELATAVPGVRGMGADPRTGTLLVFQRAADSLAPVADSEARLTAIAGVPVRIRLISGTIANASATGGGRVVGPSGGHNYICTTGFVVTAGNNRGITTAAHCPDQLSYRGPDGEERLLTMVGSWGAGARDVQVMAGSGGGPALFFADTAKTIARPVTGWLTRPMTRAGDWVCKRGELSGASCAEIELTDFAPPGELCGGLCSASWVTVSGPVCSKGDSGAPVYIGTTALGLLKGGAFVENDGCAFYYYMSLDYLPGEWRVVRSEVPDLSKSSAARGGTTP